MSFSLSEFANDRFIILKLICEHQIEIKGEKYTALSQQEIADMAHFSKLKTNRIINELIEFGCLCVYNGKKGKYALTDNGYQVISFFEKII